MPAPTADRCAACGAEERNPLNLALKLEGLQSWILLPHCGKCADASPEAAEATARRLISDKRERLAAKENGRPTGANPPAGIKKDRQKRG